MKRTIVKVSKYLLVASLAIGLLVFYADWHVTHSSEAFCVNISTDIPSTHVAVVLGTSPKLRGGQENPYFNYRIDAAVELFELGKVDRILVSGDNRTEYYNEPIAMQKALVERGVPEDRIHLDYAGLRTLDSMVRTKDIFQQDSVIVVSQAFHNQRAVYIAHQRGLFAWGYNAKDVDVSVGFRTRLREAFARAKMLLDLYVLDTQPRHLGEKEIIPLD